MTSSQAAYFAAGRKLNGAHLVRAAIAIFAAAAKRGSELELRTLGGSASDPSLANFTRTVTIRLGASRTACGTTQQSANRAISFCISLSVSAFGSGALRGF